MVKQHGSKKRSNGHKLDCGCPICNNMRHAKKGGSLTPATIGGKKANGHKANCKCPICINMKHMTSSKKNRRVKRNRTRRGGKPDDEDSVPDSDDDEHSDSDSDEHSESDSDSDEHSDSDDEEVQPVNLEANFDDVADDDSDYEQPTKKQRTKGGGRKKRKGNGHKANCGCPICKNMRKSKRGGEPEETPASTDDYDSLDKVGGSRKRRKGKSRKTRKHRRR